MPDGGSGTGVGTVLVRCLSDFGAQCRGTFRLEGSGLRLQGFMMRDRENGFYSEAHSTTHFLFFGICRATTACGGLVSSVCQASHSQAGLAPTKSCTGSLSCCFNGPKHAKEDIYVTCHSCHWGMAYL